jgi:hypothetical protein
MAMPSREMGILWLPFSHVEYTAAGTATETGIPIVNMRNLQSMQDWEIYYA